MALGAAPAASSAWCSAASSLLVGLGIVGGLAASLWAATFVTTLLYGLAAARPGHATLGGARPRRHRRAGRLDSGAARVTDRSRAGA